MPGSESAITSSIVVTETKKKESQSEASSEEDEDSSTHSGKLKKEKESQSSTCSEGSKEDKGSKNEESDEEEDPTSQAKMSTPNTPFDVKLEHVLVNYFFALGVDHEIRMAFIHEGIMTFDNFVLSCDVDSIKLMERDDGSNNIVQAFSNSKLKLIEKVILYYDYLMNNQQEILARDPVVWVKSDYFKWLSTPKVGTAATQNASNSTTQQASNVTPPSTTKLEDDALLNWRKSRQDVNAYPIIDNDVQYPDWII